MVVGTEFDTTLEFQEKEDVINAVKHWQLRAARLKKLGGGWGITRYKGPHTCVARAISLDHRQLDSNFICNCILEGVKKDPSKSVGRKHGRLNRRLLPEFGVIGMNHTNVYHISLQLCNRQILEVLYVIDSIEFTKPVIQIDGTFLYGKYKHSLLIATTIDGDNSMIPLAYALVESENVDSWGWFMALLRTHVVRCDGICVISDRHIGIMQTMNNQYLGWDETHAKYRYCLRHVASNFNTRFKNVGLKNLLIKAGRTCQVRKCERVLEWVKERNDEA
ncbi:uncharacterized protein LOC122048789 [Zingiber officinale]|uniref:uncharacterized protein LOC122048789 n=1 Tax=Zingiber officinale TaxID=94328 RepID=UPI001C4CB509|nr:uncharacterized protein LOC122048789 [Zingiber officinale]